MEEIKLNPLDHIPVPQDLETRLSQQIDQWAAAEQRSKRRRKAAWLTAGSVAAAIVAGAFVMLPGSAPSHSKDTYSDPRLAYEEAAKAVDLLVNSMACCQENVALVERIAQQTEQIISQNI